MSANDRGLFTRLIEVALTDVRDHPLEQSRCASARALFDALVCMAAGSPASRAVPQSESGPAPLVGTPVTAGLLGAIAANAIAVHADDLDDVHWPTATHPGSVIWPALLCVAVARGSPVSRLLDAAAFGYQVCARTAVLLGAEHRRRFHATTTAGVIAVAAAVAALEEDADEQVVTAMLHAASGMGGTAQALRERSKSSMLHRAYAATAGVIAAQHRHLVPSVAAPLTGEFGFAAATAADLAYGSLDMGTEVAVLTMTRRSHPVTGFAHTAVDAILSAPDVVVQQVDRVHVEVPSFAVELTEPELPSDARTAAWSLPFAAAAAVARELPAGHVSWPPSAAVAYLMPRVVIEARDAMPPDLAVRGNIVTVGGDVIAFSRQVPHGHHDDPLSDEELVEKARRLGVVTQDDGAALLGELLEARTTAISTVSLAVLRGSGRPPDAHDREH